MADVESRVVITAEDRTRAAFAQLDGALGGLGAKFGAVAVAAASVATVMAGARWLTDITAKSIEAAGHLNDLSQSTGVSGASLSRFSIAAKQSGLDVDGLAGGLQKLNVKIDESAGGNREATDTFARLGISVRTANGEVRSSEDVLLDVAEKFSGMEDGAAKTAVAMGLFGKSGAALIPFLNQGRDGLEEAARAADALGITLNNNTIRAADQVGDSLDLMGMISTGLGNKIMAELLPTVLQITRSFTAWIVETGALDVAAQVVAGTFRLLVNVGQVVYGTFAYLGTVVGATAAALIQFVQGEYTQAWTTLKTGFGEAGATIARTGTNIAATWTESDSTKAASSERAGPALGRMAARAAEVKPEVDKAAEATLKLFDALEKKIVATETEISTGRRATEVDQLRTNFLAGLEAGTLRATEAEQAAYLAMLDRLQAGSDMIASDQTRLRIAGELATQVAADARAREAQLNSVQSTIDKQRDENAAIGLTKEQLAELSAKRYEDMAAQTNQRIDQLMTVGALGDEYDSLVQLVEKYRTMAGEIRAGGARQAVVDSATAAAREWERTSQQIESSLTDALMRGFESGRGFMDNLKTSMRNMFNTLVLRPIIQAVVQPIAGGLTAALGLTGMAGTANAATGAGGTGILGTLGNLGSIGSALTGGIGGAFGGLLAGPMASVSAAFGAGGAFGGSAYTAAALGELGLASTGAAAGAAGSTLGTLASTLGTAAPYLLAAYALYTALAPSRGGPKSGGSFNSSGGDRLFTPNQADSQVSALGAGILGSISNLAAELGGSSTGLQIGLGYDTDPQGTAQNRIASFLQNAGGTLTYDNRISRSVGRDEAALQTELGNETAKLVLAGLQQSELPAAVRDYLRTIDVASFQASQLDGVISAAKALLPPPAQSSTAAASAVDSALADPGTYSAVSTEVRELVTISTDMLALQRQQLEAVQGARTSTQTSESTLAALATDLRAYQASAAALLVRMANVVERWDGDGLPATRLEV